MKDEQNKANRIHLKDSKCKSRDRMIAGLATGGIGNSAMLISAFSVKYGDLSLTECMAAMAENILSVHKGDLHSIETTLTAQISALDMVFLNLALRAQENNNVNTFDKLMKLALKAQGQCRSTAQTLADIKNPKPYIQNNKAHYQQVNNACPPNSREKRNLTNELLENDNEEWLDQGKKETTIRQNSTS